MSEIVQLAAAVRPQILATERRLTVVDALHPVLPGGLQRGTVISIDGIGATSLTLALCAGPSSEGSWVGFVGGASMGWAAAEIAGVDPRRTLVVTTVAAGEWATITAALADAVEMVVITPRHAVARRDADRLAARARERGAVLVLVGSRRSWPTDPDVELISIPSRWHGIRRGHGHLAARSVLVTATGRRSAARRRSTEVWLPSEDGTVGTRSPRTATGADLARSDLVRPDADGPVEITQEIRAS